MPAGQWEQMVFWFYQEPPPRVCTTYWKPEPWASNRLGEPSGARGRTSDPGESESERGRVLAGPQSERMPATMIEQHKGRRPESSAWPWLSPANRGPLGIDGGGGMGRGPKLRLQEGAQGPEGGQADVKGSAVILSLSPSA